MPTTELLPPFQLEDDSGTELAFPSGRNTLLCFVKEDCPTCRISMPLIQQLGEAFKDRLDLWAVGQDALGNAVLVDDYGFTSPMLDDSELKASFDYGIETVPTVILADPKGGELRRFVGFGRDDWRDLVHALADLTLLDPPEVEWDAYPESRPGCGSKSVEPGIYERLVAEAEGSPLRARRLEIGVQDDVMEFLYDQGMTDGMPVVPPTPERVLRMLEYTRRDPQQEIAVLPPNLAPLTVEKVAINAVLAGCKPEYFPVVLAAVDVVVDPSFGIHAVMATTMGGTPIFVVNGPIRERIGMNMGQGVLGQGNRANATIGRAVKLVLRNVGGARPGGTERATIGNPLRFSGSFAEWEERAPQWTPLHVEQGFERDQSVVTVFAMSGGPAQVIDQHSRTARALAGSIALKAQGLQHPVMVSGGATLIVVSPEHYDTLAGDGYSKDDLRRRIQEMTARPLRDTLATEDHGGLGPVAARFSAGIDELTDEVLDERRSKFLREDWIHIVVAGGGAGKWTALFEPLFSGPTGPTCRSRVIEEL